MNYQCVFLRDLPAARRENRADTETLAADCEPAVARPALTTQ